jgi:hypothetical protein
MSGPRKTLTVLVCFDNLGLLGLGQLPHLSARLAEDAIGTQKDVPAEG